MKTELNQLYSFHKHLQRSAVPSLFQIPIDYDTCIPAGYTRTYYSSENADQRFLWCSGIIIENKVWLQYTCLTSSGPEIQCAQSWAGDFIRCYSCPWRQRSLWGTYTDCAPQTFRRWQVPVFSLFPKENFYTKNLMNFFMCGPEVLARGLFTSQ